MSLVCHRSSTPVSDVPEVWPGGTRASQGPQDVTGQDRNMFYQPPPLFSFVLISVSRVCFYRCKLFLLLAVFARLFCPVRSMLFLILSYLKKFII